jgi:DNA-binding PadR family transcriptional regulator
MLQPHVLLVLAVLADGPAHGYRLRREILHRSNNTIRLDPGSLYRLISRMLDDGAIAETPDGAAATEGPPRRTYRLTPAGRRVLQEETARLADLVKRVQVSTARRTRPT